MTTRWVSPTKAESNYRAHALDADGRTYCRKYGTPIGGWESASERRPRCRRCVRAVVDEYVRSIAASDEVPA